MKPNLPRVALRCAATAAAAMIALAGCGNDHPGSAAVVGGKRITTAELTALVDRSLADPQARQQAGKDKAGFERRELGQLISHEVVAEAARREHVTVSDGDVDQRLAGFAQQAGGQKQLEQQAAQNGIAKSDLRDFVRDLTLQDAIADKLVADTPVPAAQLEAAYRQNIDQFDQVHSAHILVKDKPTADRLLAQVKANPASFAALAKQFSIDTSNKDRGGDLSFAGRGQFVKEFSNAIFAAAPGSFLEVHSQFGWHVVHVIERRTKPLAEVTPDLKRQVLSDQRQTKLQQLLSQVAKDLKISVNPRFGTFNVKTGQVDAPKDTLSSPTPSGSAAPSPSGSPGG